MTRCMFLILAAAVSATAADGVIRRLVWQVETSDPVERHWALTYGETVDFEVQYLDHRRPMDLAGGSVVLHARTNGMDTGLSYQATGSVMSAQGWATVRVAVDDLLPAGLTAASYRIAVTKGGSTNLLAAAGTFRLTGSGAGLAGAALPTPVAMEIREEMAAGTNQVMALLGPRITTLESGTNNWSAAFSWGPHFAAGYLLPSDIAGLATTQQVAAAAAAKLDAAYPAAGLRAEWVDVVPGYDDIGHLRIYDAVSQESVYIGPYGFGQWRYMDAEYYPEGVDRFVSWADVSTRADIAAASNNLAGVIGALTAADVGALPSQSTETQLRVDWHPDVYGTGGEGHLRIYDPLSAAHNAVYFGPLGFGQFRGDDLNYPYGIDRFVLWTDLATLPDLDGATNAIVQSHLLGSNAWMIVSNDVLRIWQLNPTNSLQTNLLWQSGDAFPPAATQTLWSAILQLTQDVDTKAPAAWGRHAPDGTANPDPDFMTFLNAPSTVYASGAQWSTYGTYAVLTATGTVAFAGGEDGQLRIGPNSTNWFGFVQGGSVTVGAQADSLTVVNGGETGGYAEIVYSYAGGDFPALWFTPTLTLDFTEVSGAAWVDNLDGTATATAPAESAAGFWYATTTATFDNYFRSTMPARFDGGVVGSTNAAPVVYDSTITISAGGKNYRIPAQEVE